MTKSKIDLSDSPIVTTIQGAVTKIKWKSGKVTILKEPFNKKCLNCGNRINRVEDIVRLEGYCRKCYPTLKFNVPVVVAGFCQDFTWDFPVKQTAYKKYEGAYSRTFEAINFGIGDIVLYHPKRNPKEKKIKTPIEGKVLDIYRYTSGGAVTFGARIDFGKLYGEKFLWGDFLEPLTNEYVSFPGIKGMSDMTDIKLRFDPMESPHKAVFKDPIARAIWIDYRRSHIMDDYALNVLVEDALKISKQLKEMSLPRNRVALFFKKMMRLNISEEDVVFMVPYLTGEKVAVYKVEL